MAYAHANASSSLTLSDSSSSLYCDDSYLELDQYSSYNVGKKRFSWNGTVEDLETFIDRRLIRSVDDGGNSDKLTNKSCNSSCAILKLSDVTFNF